MEIRSPYATPASCTRRVSYTTLPVLDWYILHCRTTAGTGGTGGPASDGGTEGAVVFFNRSKNELVRKVRHASSSHNAADSHLDLTYRILPASPKKAAKRTAFMHFIPHVLLPLPNPLRLQSISSLS